MESLSVFLFDWGEWLHSKLMDQSHKVINADSANWIEIMSLPKTDRRQIPEGIPQRIEGAENSWEWSPQTVTTEAEGQRWKYFIYWNLKRHLKEPAPMDTLWNKKCAVCTNMYWSGKSCAETWLADWVYNQWLPSNGLLLRKSQTCNWKNRKFSWPGGREVSDAGEAMLRRPRADGWCQFKSGPCAAGHLRSVSPTFLSIAISLNEGERPKNNNVYKRGTAHLNFKRKKE